MNTRHILLALVLLATVACTAEPSDSTDATEDEYRVKPRGNSTLGALTIDVPDGVRPGQDRQTLMVSVRSQAPDGTISPDAQYVDLPIEFRQRLLASRSPLDRLELLLETLSPMIAQLEVGANVHERARTNGHGHGLLAGES